MQIEYTVHGPNLVVRVRGDLDLHAAGAFRRAVDGALARTRTRNLYLHMAGVTFMDSSGLGVLLGRYRRIAQAGGRMGVIAPGPAVRRVLDLAGAHKFLEIHESEGAVTGEH